MTISTSNNEFRGEVIAANINTVTVGGIDGGYTIVPRKDVLAVQIDINGGEVIQGFFHDWQEGLYVLKVEGRLVGVQDGEVTFVKSAGFATPLPSGGPKTALPLQNQNPAERLPQDDSDQPSKLDGAGPASRIQM